jgi:parallel beta-helix repeat protein
MRSLLPWSSADPSAPLMPRALLALTAAAAIALSSLAAPAGAAESEDACTDFITALPALIDASGTWCLQESLTTPETPTQYAISIAAKNVVLDCNGHRIRGGLPRATTNQWGILGNAPNLANITVRNCDLSGFLHGVFIYGDGVVVEDNRISESVDRGIYLQGQNGIVRRNRITGIGTDRGTRQYSLIGISVFGDIDVVDNEISELRATPGTEDAAYGIFKNDDASVPTSSLIAGNRIRGLFPDGTAEGVGIVAAGQGPSVIRDNTFWGSAGQLGIYCWYSTPPTRVTTNILFAGTPITGCTAHSGNIEKS